MPTTLRAIRFRSLLARINSTPRALSTSISSTTDGVIGLYSLAIVVGSTTTAIIAIGSLLYTPVETLRRSQYQAEYLLRTRRYRRTIALSGSKYLLQIKTIQLSRHSRLVYRQSITTVVQMLQACYSIVVGNEVSASVRHYYAIRGVEYRLRLYVQY